MTARPPRLACIGISKRFPGVQALDRVSLEVMPGEVHALVGENGAGKSTLMKVLAGAHRPDEGRVELDGKAASIDGAAAARRLGIAIVYQELSVVDDLTVAENVYLGRWPSGAGGLIQRRRLHAQTREMLDRLGVTVDPQARAGSLTIARKQMVEIARALTLDARVLILDEPSAVLTSHELEQLMAIVRDLRNAGVSIIYISHRLEEIFEIADRVTVLRDGRLISTKPTAETDRSTLIAEMVGRAMTNEFPEHDRHPGDVVLAVGGLSCPRRFQDVTFDVRGGEVVALTGLVGAGRTSVARAVFGAVRAHGRLSVGDRRGPFPTPRHAMRAGVAMLPEDRKAEGLLLARPVRENITLANLGAVSRFGMLQRERERQVAGDLIEALRVRTAGMDVPAETLSGGNQQKLLLARWMSKPHRLFIFDEPTRGVDVGAKYEIYTMINRLADDGAAVLIVTSELPEAIGMADRIGVMHEGRLTGILDNSQGRVSQQAIMELASGRVA